MIVQFYLFLNLFEKKFNLMVIDLFNCLNFCRKFGVIAERSYIALLLN